MTNNPKAIIHLDRLCANYDLIKKKLISCNNPKPLNHIKKEENDNQALGKIVAKQEKWRVPPRKRATGYSIQSRNRTPPAGFVL